MVATLHSPTRIPRLIQTETFDPIQARVQNVLDTASYSELRQVRCERKRGIIFLRGRVRSYFLKQLAQEVIRDVEGVSHLVNAIEVLNNDQSLR